MADRLDIILFGASGFTGKHTIPYVHKFSRSDGRSLSWGIAGRSKRKLTDTLKEVSKKLNADFGKIPIIMADISDRESLRKMAERAKIVINCCGPYKFYGEPVVKACIDAGTNQVDVSAEPEYAEKIQSKYYKDAKEKGIYIISTCGFGSIPAELGVIYLEKQFNGTLNSVDSYLDGCTEGPNLPGPSINYGTWHSAVYGLVDVREIRSLFSQLYPKTGGRFVIHKSRVVDGWAVPFLGSDRSVVLRSQRYFYNHDKKRPIRMQTYLNIRSFFDLIVVILCGCLFGALLNFKFGRRLLLKYPKFFSLGYFSHEAPSEEKQNNTHFSITFYGEGWKEKLPSLSGQYKSPVDKAIIGRVTGSNPGYGATCLALTLAAITVITEKDKLPDRGGVYPPGAAFAKTSLIEQLHKHGLKFETLSIKNL